SDQQMLEGVILAQRERAKTMKEMAVNSRFFFVEDIELDLKAAAKHLGGDAPATLAKVRARLGSLSEWNAASVHAALEQLAAELGGELLECRVNARCVRLEEHTSELQSRR